MPFISNTVIHELYERYGNDDYPVEQYCIGCLNCESYGFPCINCAIHVFSGQLGQGNDGNNGITENDPTDMDIDEDIIPGIQDIPDIVNDNDIMPDIPTIDDRISTDTDSSDDEDENSTAKLFPWLSDIK